MGTICDTQLAARMNNQQPYILPWQAYGLNGFSNPLGVSISSPLQARQIGKLAGLPIAQQAYQQHQNLVSMGSALAGIPGLTQISFAGNGGLQLAGAGVYPIMSPSLSPYGMQSPPPGMGMNPTVLTNNGMSQIPKLFMPSVKVGLKPPTENCMTYPVGRTTVYL